MSGREPSVGNPLVELRFALAEGDAVDTPEALRARVLAAAAASRPPGEAVDRPEHIAGTEVLRRSIAHLDALLTDLAADDWSRPALRDLDVQGLVGHLIGVEEAFAAAVAGDPDVPGASDHIGGTQSAAIRQAGQAPAATHREWFDRATESIAAVAGLDPSTPVSFYGVTLPIDALLVVRAFEMWIHDEDIRRATDRPLAAPDAEQLGRMVALVTTLLPAGLARAGRAQPGRTVRVVLTGAGGGTCDMNLDGTPVTRRADAHVVVDAVEFCRVVGNRADLVTAHALVQGDASVASDLFVGAAALALD